MAVEAVSKKIGFLLASVNRQLAREVEEELRPTKFPIEQIRVLQALADKDAKSGRTMSQIAHLVVVDASTLTKIIDRMTSESLVYRAVDPEDRRRVMVLITDKGRQSLKKLEPRVKKIERKFLSTVEEAVGPASADTLVGLLERLTQHQIDKERSTKG